MTTQVEFSDFFKILDEIKGGDDKRKDSLNTILKNYEEGINAKSVLGVTMLAAGFGSQVTISTQGEDEELAIKEINDLFINKFGEKE